MQQYPSIVLENAVNEFAKLPGIGRKTALRLALFLLKQKDEDVELFGNTMIELKKSVHFCRTCHNISDFDECEICADPNRDKTTVCVVESIKDVMAIENTNAYKGVYHLLGGLISPMNGIGPNDLEIASLVERIANNEIKEIVLALNPNMEGDTTCFFIYRKLVDFDIKITTIARGVAIGDELEYADEITLGRSIINRINYSG
ncbi:MAG: recombination protein RecR [Paludibacteraceae bacterium]|jgi:recombination protein RecR|nr:recombination protein RecR [Paludibacteraceae bacterium]MDI9537202.1 recombination mediator RecR [Bacteroidota bacterium]HHT61284.1 recombination protein RecR [Bacteroidales bacterium]MBP9039218.1 recombination protein RecR [Paludibacteraceae bacterium]HOA46301.1 recombination mediator RecR [Paludibacteraceae bacterium]